MTPTFPPDFLDLAIELNRADARYLPGRRHAVAVHGRPRATKDFDLWVEEIPFEETRNYLKRVLGNEAAYAFLYAPSALEDVLSLPSKVQR